MNEDERRALVEGDPIYLQNGLRARFVGWKDPHLCGVHSAEPDFWAVPWETAKRVAERPNRRMDWLDNMFRTGGGWLGYTPQADDFQTPADYEAWRAAQRREGNQ